MKEIQVGSQPIPQKARVSARNSAFSALLRLDKEHSCSALFVEIRPPQRRMHPKSLFVIGLDGMIAHCKNVALRFFVVFSKRYT
jgi:hypothetical protein